MEVSGDTSPPRIPLNLIGSPQSKGFLPEIVTRNNGNIANAFGDISFDYVQDIL